MSFRGGSSRGGSNFSRGGSSSRGSFGRGGGRGGYNNAPMGPPSEVQEMGTFVHPCQEDIVCKSINEMVPYFNAPIFLENKSQVGKVDDIFGPINERYFTVKLDQGVVAGSFKKEQKLYIDPAKLLPLSRFLGQQSSSRGVSKPGRGGPPSRGGFRGAPRGGRGSFGAPRGAPRGGFSRGGSSSFGGRGGFRGGRGGSF